MAAYRFKSLAALAVLLLSAAACKYPYDLTIERGDYPLVVEGEIFAGTWSTVQLSYAFPLDGDAYVASAIIASGYIEGEDGSRIQQDPQRSYGSFLAFDTRQIGTGQRYRMHLDVFGYNNSSFFPGYAYFDGVPTTEGATPKYVLESDWVEICPAPVIDGLSYSLDSPRDELDIGLSMHCQGSSHFRWTFFETWEYHSDIQTVLEYNPMTREVITGTGYYSHCWSTAASSKIQIFSTENQTEDRFEDLRFHIIPLDDRRLQVLYRIDVQLYALSEGAYTYWRNIQENTSGQGSIFAPTPSMMASNIRCLNDPEYQVLGYLNASQIAQGRLYYDNSVAKYHKPPRGGYYEKYETEVPNSLDANQQAFNRGLLPYQGIYQEGSMGEPTSYMWASAICIDCRRSGGSPNKPSDWPK